MSPGAPIPPRMCDLVIEMYYADGRSNAWVSRTLKMDVKTVRKILWRFRTGQKLALPGRTGTVVRDGSRMLGLPELDHLRSLLFDDCTWYLDELVVEMEALFPAKRFTVATLCRGLAQMKITRKRLYTKAREATVAFQGVFRLFV